MKTNIFIYYKQWAVLFIVATSLLLIVWAQQFNWKFPVIGIGLIGVLLNFIDEKLWKYKPFSFLFTIDDFSGTYKGTQHCFFIPEEEKDQGCNVKETFMDVTMIIVQTGSEITVTAFYKNANGIEESSNSHSDICVITKTKDKQHFQILYHYTNNGNKSKNYDEHCGTSIIKIIKKNNEFTLKGNYYTNRLPFPTRGKFLNLKRVSKDTNHPT